LEDKKLLRKKIQSARDGLPATERAKKSRAIAGKFLESEDYKKASNILIYFPFRSEIDTTLIIKKALADRKKIILPRVKDKTLKLYFVTDPGTQLEKGAYGIMEPIDSVCSPAEPEQIDLAIIPGVCFDSRLNRMGYGGGFYDRLIPDIPLKVKKIALCFDLQIIKEVPVSGYDIKIDRIITESAEYKIRDPAICPEIGVKNNEIAILIPAYNEGKYIGNVIEDCLTYGMDVIVVDDGSSDDTADAVKLFASRLSSRVFLIQHGKNKGKGQALKTGFSYGADKKYSGLITIDADGQHDVSEIADFLRAVKEKNPDIIVGSRFQNIKGMPFVRLATNFFTSWIISAIAGRKINDVQSGFRFIGRRALNINLETKNFETEPEILLKASWLNYKIINIPITTIYHENFVSHVNPFIDTYKFFRLVFRSIILKRRFMRSHTTT
jgi:5,10-methenyltetrahydrofolate synthetase